MMRVRLLFGSGGKESQTTSDDAETQLKDAAIETRRTEGVTQNQFKYAPGACCREVAQMPHLQGR